MIALWIAIFALTVSSVFLWLALHQVWVEFVHSQDPVDVPPLSAWKEEEEGTDFDF